MATGSAGGPRQEHTSTVLQDGRVLLAGGHNGLYTLDSLAIFDPATGSIATLAATMSHPRVEHQALRVPGEDGVMDTADDVVVILGGLDADTGDAVPSVDIFDPDANDDGVGDDPRLLASPVDFGALGALNWSSGAAPFAIFGFKAALAGPGNEIVLVGGMAAHGGASGWITNAKAMLYEPIPGTTGDYSASRVGVLAAQPEFMRLDHSATQLPGPDGAVGTLDDAVVVYGGLGYTTSNRPTSTLGSSNRAISLGSGEWFDPATNTWTRILDNDFYPDSPQIVAASLYEDTPRSLHSATLLADGQVLLAGGINDEPNQLLPDPTNPTGPAVPYFGDNLTQTAEVFTPNYQSPASGRFDFTDFDPIARMGHSATRLGDGRVLLAGGQDLLAGGGTTVSSVTFDPAAPSAGGPQAVPGAFSVTGDLGTSSALHGASALLGPDGKAGTADDRVVVTGGVDTSVGVPLTVAGAEVYTP